MATDSLINEAFTDAFNEAGELYDNNRLGGMHRESSCAS
jgi:hypothetical protein